jgi:hypothetical protein
MLGTAAGRMLAADGGPLIGSRYAKLLVLSATLTAVMVVGLLAFATSARADVACVDLGSGVGDIFCLKKTATPDPVEVGEPLTFTIRGFCDVTAPGVESCGLFGGVIADTLPAGVKFVSASATGVEPATCSESAGTMTCGPVSYFFHTGTVPDIPPEIPLETPFVATIEVIPTQCGTFTNTASYGTGESVSETFTVVGCVPTSEEQCKGGGYVQFGFANQGRCIKAVKQER